MFILGQETQIRFEHNHGFKATLANACCLHRRAFRVAATPSFSSKTRHGGQQARA
jgi:hypothetical protein